MLSNSPRRLGAILSGGRSSRFGTDKAEAMLGSRRLIEHAASAIADRVETTIICGPHHVIFQRVDDRPSPSLGPLGGLCGALHHGRAHGFDAVVTIACDMPVVPPALLDELTVGATRFCESAPVLGCWDVGLAKDLDAFLHRSTRRSIHAFAAAVGATAVPWGALPNVNTPADLAAL